MKMSKLILTLVVAVAVGLYLVEASSSTGRSYSRIPRKSSPGVKRIKLERDSERHVLRKLAILYSRESLDKSHVIPLMNQVNTIFYGNVSFGTPGQSFKLMFDTKSSELSIPSNLCKSRPCVKHNKFDSSRSSTYQDLGRKVDIYEGRGKLGKDTVTLGDMKVTNQSFAQLLSTNDIIFSIVENDGYLGLQPAPTYFGREEKSFFQNLIDQKQIDEPMFSFYLNKGKTGNELILGGIDESLYKGDITYVPLTSDVFWEFKMDKMQVRDKNSSKIIGEVCSSGCRAVAATGSSLLVGPRDQVAQINKAIGAVLDKSGEFYNLPDCSKEAIAKYPPIEFVIGGRSFEVTADKYVFVAPNWCMSVIVPDDQDWILGDPFLRSYYSIYDLGNKRFGLAAAV